MNSSSEMKLASARVQRSPGVISQTIADELVLLNPKTEDFVALDRVGTQIWSLLEGSVTSHFVGEQIAQTYSIEAQGAIDDTNEFLGRLVSLGLVEILSDESGDDDSLHRPLASARFA